jgi:membrane dipeptidase
MRIIPLVYLLSALVAVLEDKYGWTEDEISGFLGENLLRVYKANWD